jgi:alpha-L-arabinofuranosidase
MASYAPLFAHLDGWQWTPDLIWVDNLNSYGTPSYYVQQLFSTNRGTQLVKALQEGKPMAGRDSLYVSAVWDDGKKELVLKMVNAGDAAVELPLQLKGKKPGKGTIQVMQLQADSLQAANSISAPRQVAPQVSSLPFPKKAWKANLPARTLTVWRIPMK